MPAGSGYTITATRYGKSASATSQSVTGGGSTPVTINLAAAATGSIKIVVKRSGGSNCNSTSFNWTIDGGPFGTSGTNTTNTSGVLVTVAGIPAFSGSSYTVSVTKTSGSGTGSRTVSVVTSGSTVTATVTLNTNTCP